ncbi:hypothetical protein ACJMK2_006363 [Sinanodonta woodiana]|uniref:Cilia- and flagella-associated protein 46 n=1 Tax=Sinanodonta woodiana TaxID=1069815 RepID=A0ABD3VSX1_SINWO
MIVKCVNLKCHQITSRRKLFIDVDFDSGQEKNPPLAQAYSMLRNVAENKPAVDSPESFSPDLYVLCAEVAFQNGFHDMARECLKMYFMKPAPANQFLCRAYLCQAQLLAPQTANNPDQLEKAVIYLLKAITFAKTNPRYHFLVYNASVIYWQFCRPFLKQNYRQYLARSLHQVVKALDDIDDNDFEWRAQLMIALIECHLDAGRKQDASQIATAAATFIKQNVPNLYKQVFGLIVRNQLVDSTKLHKDVKTSPELAIYYKICKLKLSIETGESKEYYSEIQRILNQLGIVTQGEPIASLSKISAMKSGPTQSPSSTGDVERKSPSKAGRRSPTPVTSKILAADSVDKPYLLLELGRLCLELDFPNLAQECVDNLKATNIKEPGFFLELEFMQCEMTVKGLGEKQESYQKNTVEVRLQSIKQCEEAIMNAVRLGDPNVIQVGCVTQWNLCLPLLQANLRHYVRKPLTQVAEVLENIQSLLIQLRCQVHTELAKCEEDNEQIQGAMDHLKKALALDDGQVYKERLEVALHRLEVRSELYKQPEKPEDIAAMIIEQARKADSGTIRMKRSLLVKAGEALAPDAFQLVLDSESDTKDVTGGKAPLTQIKKLANKARQFVKCVKKAEGHLKRLGDENDRERARLWGDLAKTARKQEVWDVCRVAARFCLLYDDNRWKNTAPVRTDSAKLSDKGKAADSSPGESSSAGQLQDKPGSRPTTPVQTGRLYDKDLVRMLAEVNFIQGESTVHLLRSEGVQLNDMPIPPVDRSKHPKGYVAKKPEEDPDWIEYCDWIHSLTDFAVKSFLRGLNLGVELEEAWLVCCASAYIWNYNNHVFTQNRHREILDTLSAVFDGLKTVGHAKETMMLINICNSMAYALMKPWIPAPHKESVEGSSPAPSRPESLSGKKGKAAPPTQKIKTNAVTISPEAMPDLKKAVEVCEYVIEVTNGSNPEDVVPIAVRMPILQTWVHVKQMAQQQISKSLGAEDEAYAEGQKLMTRAIVAVEMLSVNKNGIMEFKEMPPITDVANLVEECIWTDKFVELQLWTRLTALAYDQKMHNLVLQCSKKALRFAQTGTQPKHRQMDAHRYMVEQEMMSYASGIQGQSLVDNMSGKNSVRREALEAFLNSAIFARNAENYEMVMTAARHYWNACLPLVSQPLERELLREPIRAILQSITATAEKLKKKVEKSETEAEGKSDAGSAVGAEVTEDEKPITSTIGAPEDDLTLRAALYGVLFQSYADKGEWERGLQAMDQAIADMPRTKHRLEDYVAHMWRRVALSSKETVEQLLSYQNAIEALNSHSSEWLKVELLIEFGQWLYVRDFPLQDAVDQLEWAIDIMLNMQAEEEEKREAEKAAAAAAADAAKAAKGKKDLKKGPPVKGPKGKKSPTPEIQVKKTLDPAGKSSDTKSETSETESEMNMEGIVPIAKEAIIGVLPLNPSMMIQDIKNVRILDTLLRVHVLLAEILGPSSQFYKDYLLLAYACLVRLWQTTVQQSGPTMKEIAKNPPPPAEVPGATGGKGSAKKKPGGKEKEPVPVKEKPKRKGPLDILPSTTEDWAVYDIPDEVMEAFKHEMMKSTGINPNTVVKPMLTLHYLDMLYDMLRDQGYNHLTLPILAFEDLLSRDLLKSDCLKKLVHLKAYEVCLELNMKNGCNFHEKITGIVVVNPDDQSVSRDEISLWKEKQAQVVKEELRAKESLARLVAEAKSSVKPPFTTRPTAKSQEVEEPVQSHLGRVLGSVTYRDVWTETAIVLIRQGQYQSAREFLSEAHDAAVVFNDVSLQAKILYYLGKLALEEAQFGQAINFCKAAQELYHGDEMFWYETTILMVDATLMDYENARAKRVARGIIVHALNEFNKILEERPNRAGTLGYILAMLEARLAKTSVSIILSEHPDINVPKVMKRVHQICERFESATEKLTRLGYKREALPIIKEHAAILYRMARDAIEKEIKHTYFLQAMLVLKDAVTLSEDVLQDVQTLFPLQEIRNISLPIQREVADIKIEYGNILLEIFRTHAKEVRSQQLEDQRKGPVLKMVEDFIRATPNYTHMEKEWVEIIKTVADDGLVKFIDAHNMASSIPRLRARALCGIGQSLQALSMYKSADQPVEWNVQDMELARMTGDQAEETSETNTHDLDPHSQQVLKYVKQIREKKEADGSSMSYLLQASECLLQALSLSLQRKYIDIAAQVSLELVESCGQFDASATSLFLALHQSCQASLHLENLLRKAQLDPMQSKLAALLNQQAQLLSRDVKYNTANGNIMSSIYTVFDQEWQAWKRMEVLPQHLDLVKEFPNNFNFIILQHSPDKDFLYGAVLDKPKSGPGGVADKKGSNPKQHTAPVTSRARVFGVETSRTQLESLLYKCRAHRQNVQQLLLKHEYQRSQVAMRAKMLANLSDEVKDQKSKAILDDSEEEERMLQEEFKDLVMAVETYLKPIMAEMEGILLPQSTTPASLVDKPGKEPKEPPPPPQEYMVLLADPDLMELPLETLQVLQSESVVSLSRDFSLQLFYHRYYQEQVQGDDPNGDKKKQKQKGLDQPFSRIPGLRDASKKQSKIIPLNRQLNPWCQPVDTMNFRYIVDPYLECAETEENKPIEVMTKILLENEQQFTPRWLGVMGDEHAPSVGEWEVYLKENSSFIFYGMEKLLSYIPPEKLSALNIPECMIVYLLDLAQTTKSFTRQSKLDVLKSSNTLSLEKPVETAMLMSLTGVKCVLENQWHCTLAENAEKLKTTIKDLLEGGKSTGEAVRLLFCPYRRKKPQPEGEGDGEEHDAQSEAGKSQGGKSQHDSGKSQISASEHSPDMAEHVLSSGEEAEMMEVNRSWFNLVCYGLPNLVVSQT